MIVLGDNFADGLLLILLVLKNAAGSEISQLNLNLKPVLHREGEESYEIQGSRSCIYFLGATPSYLNLKYFEEVPKKYHGTYR